MQAFLRHVVLNPMVLAVVALLGLIIGGVLVYDTPRALLQARWAAQAPAFSASTPTADALLEGQISASTPLRDGWAVFIREQYRSTGWFDDTPRWIELERYTPPLRITARQADIPISNDDYLVEDGAVTIQEAAPTFAAGAIQRRGYTPGDVVLARVTSAGGTTRAIWLYPGTRAGYIAHQQQIAARSLPVGVALLAVGLLCAGLAIWQMRRVLHEIRAEQATEQAERERRASGQPARRRRR